MTQHNTSNTQQATPAQIDKISEMLHTAEQHFNDGMWITAKNDVKQIYNEFEVMYPTLRQGDLS